MYFLYDYRLQIQVVTPIFFDCDFNPFGADQRHIVVSNSCEKCQQRYIVAYAMTPYYSHRERTSSQNKFIKRYKWLNFFVEALCEMFHKLKKLFMGLTFCYILR